MAANTQGDVVALDRIGTRIALTKDDALQAVRLCSALLSLIA
jgi:hypothetical protein